MIDLDFLESLIRAVDESSIDSVEIERGGTRIRVSKTPPAPPAPSGGGGAPVAWVPAPRTAGGGDAASSGPSAPGAAEAATSPSAAPDESEEADDGLIEVASPMVGTFYRAPGPDAPPYVEVGDRVARGETLCIIEAMKLMNELESELAGTVVEICVENADPVEYGQPLFRIQPA